VREWPRVLWLVYICVYSLLKYLSGFRPAGE